MDYAPISPAHRIERNAPAGFYRALRGTIRNSLQEFIALVACTARDVHNHALRLVLAQARRLACEQLKRLGGTRVRFGPLRGVQFTAVALGRALRHHQIIYRRTHAQRQSLSLSNNEEGGEIRKLSVDQLRRLQAAMEDVRKRRKEPAAAARELTPLMG